MTATAASSLSSLSYPDAYSETASDHFPYCHFSELHTESDESPVGKGVVWYLDRKDTASHIYNLCVSPKSYEIIARAFLA
jgi:hypothetical protein